MCSITSQLNKRSDAMKQNKRSTTILTALLFLTLGAMFPVVGQAEEGGMTAGLRAGVDMSDSLESFEQYEVAFTYRLPWTWDLSGRQIGTRLNVNIGTLKGAGETCLVAYTGPSLFLRQGNFEFFAGSSVARIGEHTFGRENFGSLFHFISHAGLSYRLPGNISLAYQVQHMSNAGLDEKNPGLNMHMFGINYHF